MVQDRYADSSTQGETGNEDILQTKFFTSQENNGKGSRNRHAMVLRNGETHETAYGPTQMVIMGKNKSNRQNDEMRRPTKSTGSSRTGLCKNCRTIWDR